ncbi:MAG: murein L,D-transpeptidase, partial [Nitrosomonas sp.]|nr:murein L,D-transpeptidase [Nitrosomonas sp.]
RTFSSGCIRLEAPLLLADFALYGRISPEALKQQIDSGTTKQINLSEPLPVYIVYLTTWIDSGQNIHYSRDIYGRDERALSLAR